MYKAENILLEYIVSLSQEIFDLLCIWLCPVFGLFTA